MHFYKHMSSMHMHRKRDAVDVGKHVSHLDRALFPHEMVQLSSIQVVYVCTQYPVFEHVLQY